jgi:hypothetical protein
MKVIRNPAEPCVVEVAPAGQRRDPDRGADGGDTTAAVRPRSIGQASGARLLRRAFGWTFRPVLDHRGAFLGVNLLYWGAVALGAVYGAVDPSTQRALTESVAGGFSPAGQLGPLVNAYLDGQLAAAIGLTFLVNLLLGALVYISLASLVLPFAGLLTGVGRGLLWGMLFTPAGPLAEPTLLLHVPTILVEGEAYVLALTGVWLWWRPVVGATGRRFAAWRDGLLLQARVYVGVALLLAVAAIYEAASVIYLIQPR